MKEHKNKFISEVWENLSSVDLTGKIQKKMNLSYLSWAWAWGVLMSKYPSSSYEFKDSGTGATMEVWCDLTISDGENRFKRSMWLPVMDYKNNSIQNPTSRDISDTRMRCLVKAMAMFGLGHYIYAGEDLPKKPETKSDKIHKDQIDNINSKLRESSSNIPAFCERLKINSVEDMPASMYESAMKLIETKMENRAKDEYLEAGGNPNVFTKEEIPKYLISTVNCIKDGIASNSLSSAVEAWVELTDEEKKSLWLAPTKGGVFTTEERSTMKSNEWHAITKEQFNDEGGQK